jgi:S1-C subfamily serine protease
MAALFFVLMERRVKNLQEATERICELKGSLVALDAMVPAVIDAFCESARAKLMSSFDARTEVARTVLLNAAVSDIVLAAFERDVARNRALLLDDEVPTAAEPRPVDALLLTTTRVVTFEGASILSSASGFFFRRDDRLFLITNRHVCADAASSHFPDRIELGLHLDSQDLTRHAVVSLPLYKDGLNEWREATDSGGLVDVAALEIPATLLPAGVVLHAFDERHLEAGQEVVEIGDALTIAGFPLGFHDTVHYLPVARSAAVASAYGIRFQRQGCFLTDARMHSGSSGSPVVRRRVHPLPGDASSPLSWQLLGVHSSRMDMRTRDQSQDESLGLNSAWYADVLLALTGTSPGNLQ